MKVSVVRWRLPAFAGLNLGVVHVRRHLAAPGADPLG
jgi:hypothetical protein